MASTAWFELAASFYAFMTEAKKHNFYSPELDNMENSIKEMRPFKEQPWTQECLDYVTREKLAQFSEKKGEEAA